MIKEEKLAMQELGESGAIGISTEAVLTGPACPPLNLTTAQDLLREQGYELLCRFGHIHATAGGQEWHICLVADMATMSPTRFLACLQESITHSLQFVL